MLLPYVKENGHGLSEPVCAVQQLFGAQERHLLHESGFSLIGHSHVISTDLKGEQPRAFSFWLKGLLAERGLFRAVVCRM